MAAHTKILSRQKRTKNSNIYEENFDAFCGFFMWVCVLSSSSVLMRGWDFFGMVEKAFNNTHKNFIVWLWYYFAELCSIVFRFSRSSISDIPKRTHTHTESWMNDKIRSASTVNSFCVYLITEKALSFIVLYDLLHFPSIFAIDNVSLYYDLKNKRQIIVCHWKFANLLLWKLFDNFFLCQKLLLKLLQKKFIF